MKKSELLKLPPMKATKEMYEKAWLEEKYDRYQRPSVTGPKYRKFYRARKTQGILEVDVFYYRDLRLKTSRPAFRIFLHDGKYDTYETIERKWRTATIENLQFGVSYNDGESAAYQTYWITEKDRKIIKDFTKNGEESPHSAILGWQQYEKHRKETDRIDDEMAIIPEIPKDFEEWAKKDAIPQYMYYESGKKIGRCTCCGKTQELSDHKYGQEGKCKYCKRKVIYKTYKKSPNIKDKSSAALIQKTPAGFVFRYFNVYQWIHAGERTEFNIYESIRITYDDLWYRRYIYSYHRYKTTNKVRWCNGYEFGGYYWGEGKEEGKAVLYPRNLKRTLKGSKLEYSGLPEFARQNIPFYQQNYIDMAKEYQGIEKLVKAGYYNLTADCISRGSDALLSLREKKLRKVLGLQGEYYNLIKKKDPHMREYRALYNCQQAGIRVTWEQVQEMSKFGRDFAIYMRHTTPHKMLRYIHEHTGERRWNAIRVQTGGPTPTDYHDYLQMAAILGYNMDDPYVLYPKNLKERHDQLVQEQEERKKELQGKKDDQKDGTLREIIKKHGWKAYEMETDDLLMRLPKRVREIRQEGQNQHHCVATYIDRMVSGETCILFIRKKEEPEESYYTVEVKGGEVIQVRGKYNADPKEDVENFIKTFKRRIQMRKAG
jgi:hypothetical protein